MTRIKIITMALLAVFCLSAIAAPGAFAAKKGEWTAKAGSKTTATSGITELEAKGGQTIKCASDTIEGEVLSRTSLTLTVSFFKCKASTGGTCKGGNAGAAKAELITIGGILLDIVFTPGGATLLQLTKLPGTISFKCGEINNEVRGAFLAPITAANEEKAKSLFFFTASGAGGVQAQTKYEAPKGEEKTAILESKLAGEPAFEQSDETGTEDTLFSETIEFI